MIKCFLLCIDAFEGSMNYNDQWYNLKSENVIENDEDKIFWDFNAQSDHVLLFYYNEVFSLLKKVQSNIVLD